MDELDRQVQMPDDNFVFDTNTDFSSDLVSVVGGLLREVGGCNAAATAARGGQRQCRLNNTPAFTKKSTERSVVRAMGVWGRSPHAGVAVAVCVLLLLCMYVLFVGGDVLYELWFSFSGRSSALPNAREGVRPANNNRDAATHRHAHMHNTYTALRLPCYEGATSCRPASDLRFGFSRVDRNPKDNGTVRKFVGRLEIKWGAPKHPKNVENVFKAVFLENEDR